MGPALWPDPLALDRTEVWAPGVTSLTPFQEVGSKGPGSAVVGQG